MHKRYSTNQNSRRLAFTLIEVLVVVAIIALLISILLPSLKTARDAARSTKCLCNLKDMGVGVNTFRMGHKERFQIVSANATQAAKADPDRILAYESGGGSLLGYPLVLLREAGVRSLHTNDDWGIPKNVIVANHGNVGNLRKFDLMVCPGEMSQAGMYNTFDTNHFGYLSYAINEDITGVPYLSDGSDDMRGIWKDGIPSGGTASNPNGRPGPKLAGRMDRIVRASEVVMLSDGGDGKTPLYINGSSGENEKVSCPGIALPFSTGYRASNQSSWGPYLEFVEYCFNNKLNASRHDANGGTQKLNLNYADGHGGTVTRVPGYGSYVPPALKGTWGIPNWTYQSRVRVSPYNEGLLPAKPQ